jgi:hypothetical protein
VGRAVVSRSADSRVDPTSAQRCAQRRAGGCESSSQPCDIVRVGGRCLRSNGEARQNRHANRRTSDFVGRCNRHHRHRNWLRRQIGDERDGLWIASATRKRGGHFATFCQCPLYPPKADIATRPLSSTALSIGQEFGASCCRIFLAKRPNVLEASF